MVKKAKPTTGYLLRDQLSQLSLIARPMFTQSFLDNFAEEGHVYHSFNACFSSLHHHAEQFGREWLRGRVMEIVTYPEKKVICEVRDV